MAQSVHLWLKANGTDVQGDSTVSSMDRANTIECVYFESSVRTGREAGSGMSTGRRSYEPIVFRKRIDKSTPLLYKALTNNEVVEGKFKFYRPSPTGDGTTEQFYTIEFSNGRIASFKAVSPDSIDPASSAHPPLEEIAILFESISWTFEPGGITSEDSWREQA
jgi:type VI secretion system secreted protein Hcp